MIVNELVNKGNVADEIPMWIERDEEAAKAVREQSKEDEEDDDQTKKSMFRAPSVPEHPSIEEGDPEDGASSRIDQLRAITPLSIDNIDASTQHRLRDANIVQLPDGTGRWMKVDERSDGTISMTPIDIEAFLRSGPIDEDELPGMPEISARWRCMSSR